MTEMDDAQRGSIKEALIARLQDGPYSRKVGELLDEFFRATVGTEIRSVIKDQLYQDMTEALAQYSISFMTPHSLVVAMFLLGVYLANKGEASLPTEIN